MLGNTLKETIDALNLEELTEVVEYATRTKDTLAENEELITLYSAVLMYNEKNKFGGRIYTLKNVCEEFGITRWTLTKAIKDNSPES